MLVSLMPAVPSRQIAASIRHLAPPNSPVAAQPRNLAVQPRNANGGNNITLIHREFHGVR